MRAAGLVASLLLAACASEEWVYVPAPNMTAAQYEADVAECRLEAGVAMLPQDRETLERSCMSQRGYVVKQVPAGHPR